MDKKSEETEEEDDKDSDTYLHRLESILKRVHGAYFESYDSLRLVATMKDNFFEAISFNSNKTNYF